MRLRPLVLTALSLCLSSSATLAAGPITSGTTVAGAVAGPSYLESWTFSGTAGNRVVVTAVTTSGALNTNIVLKAPGGAQENTTSGGDRLDWQLVSTGTYTIEVQDVGLNDAGNYAIAFTNLTAGPLSGGGDTDGGGIVSSDVKTGTISGPGDIDAFTFTGTLNSRILFDAVSTGGAGFDTEIFIYPPNGAGFYTYTSADRFEMQLTASGTWTVLIEDYLDDQAGSYTVSFLNVTAGPLTGGGDTDGGAIVSNEIKTGQLQAGPDFDAYTFFGFAGNHVYFTGVTTGGSMNSNLYIYPPNGGTSLTSSSSDYLDLQLPVTGTYTIVMEDVGNDTPGSYTISALNCTGGPFTSGGDPDGGFMTPSDVKSGTMSGVGDLDAFTFQGNFNDRILIDLVETAGAGLATYMVLYPPNGGSYVTYATDRLDWQLNATGIWTIMIYDNGFDTAGSYSLSLMNVTSGPFISAGDPNGGAIASNEIKNGTLQQGVDFDAYTFTGVAGHHVFITGVATGGGTHNTNLNLFPPGGAAYESSSSSDYIDIKLAWSGTYTLVVEDVGNNDSGTYTISMVDLTSGPYTNAGDTNGGPIASAAVKSGTISGVGDLDAYTFPGTSGDRVVIDAMETAGAGFSTYIVLYGPDGGAYLTYATDRLDAQLNATGTWTALIYDNGFDTGGSYDLSFLNISAGPHTSGSDTDGGAIASDQIKNGQFQQGVDLDAYTFTGVAGHRFFFTCVATGGGTHNTNMLLYPPDGGAYETTGSGDYMDWALLTSGTYTVVVEDLGNNDAGTYVLSMVDLTAGPYTSAGDPDGGAFASTVVKTGSMSGVGDLDAYTFTGTSGNRVLIDNTETGGASFSSYIVLYPPNGLPYLTYASTGRLDIQLNATGTWTALIYDNGFDAAGSYEMSFLNVTAGPLTNGTDTDGGAIVSSDIKTGSFQQGTDFDAYTFSGNAGQRVIMAGVGTGGAQQNTMISLYPPTGGVAEVTTTTDRLEAQLARTGTYTIVIEDQSNDATGGYVLSLLNVTAGPLTNGSDANGGPMVSNQVVTGSMSGIADMDAYTFSGTYGQRILATAIATAGVNFNTTLWAYPPGGAASPISTGADQLDFSLNASGIWTIVIDDNASDTAGNYSLSVLNLTEGAYSGSGETDGGPITDNVTKLGSIYAVGDVDGYTFFGITGQTAHITATATSGLLDTHVVLYPPNGGANIHSTTTDDSSPILPADGYYTLVVQDYTDDATGNYSLKVDLSGGVTPVNDTPPIELALHNGVPSPFSQSTRIDYEIPTGDRVRLHVYDVTGARIRTLVDESRSAGRYAATWDGRDDSGRRVASGVYYVRMETRTSAKQQKVVLVR